MDRRQQILNWIKETIDENLSGKSYEAFVFGSQANQPVLSRSDIDIGILADEITSEQIARISAGIEELPTLYKIDLVNFNEVDESFKNIAFKNLERI
ncbi:MAG: nucleotidyltransferase domain-containing protein [Mucilaginibacter sp.]